MTTVGSVGHWLSVRDAGARFSQGRGRPSEVCQLFHPEPVLTLPALHPPSWEDLESGLTFYNGGPPRAIVIDLLDVPKVDVAEEDAVGGARGGACSVVESQSDDVLHVLRVLKGLHRRIEVALI